MSKGVIISFGFVNWLACAHRMTSRLSMSTKVPSNVKRLILVRHGEVDLSAFAGKKVFYGGADIPLSDQGKHEAELAAAYITESESVQAVWSSPLSRAVFGAERIAVACGLPVNTVVKKPSFREVDRGAWYGLTENEVGAHALGLWNEGNEVEGESLPEVARRVLAERDVLLQTVPFGSTTVLVSHLWVTRSIVGDALGYSTKRGETGLLVGLNIPTASISVIDYTRVASGSCGGSGLVSSVRSVGIKPPEKREVAGDKWGG